MPDPSLADQLEDLARSEIRGLIDARKAAALILRYAESPETYEDRASLFGRPSAACSRRSKPRRTSTR